MTNCATCFCGFFFQSSIQKTREMVVEAVRKKRQGGCYSTPSLSKPFYWDPPPFLLFSVTQLFYPPVIRRNRQCFVEIHQFFDYIALRVPPCIETSPRNRFYSFYYQQSLASIWPKVGPANQCLVP